MTFEGKSTQTSLQGDAVEVSTGPVAAFVGIKHVGTNGDISVAAAHVQAKRIALKRNIDEGKVLQCIEKHTESGMGNFFGQSIVNVLALNLALDDLATI